MEPGQSVHVTCIYWIAEANIITPLDCLDFQDLIANNLKL